MNGLKALVGPMAMPITLAMAAGLLAYVLSRWQPALCKLLAERLGVSRSRVLVLSGRTSRRKEVLVERASPSALDGII